MNKTIQTEDGRRKTEDTPKRPASIGSPAMRRILAASRVVRQVPVGRRHVVALVLMLAALVAPLRAEPLSVSRFFADYSGTNGLQQKAWTNQVNGWIEEIYVDAPAAGFTGTVSVTYQPVISTMSAVSLMAATTVSGDTVVRPRYFGTDAGGNIPSTNAPLRFGVSGQVVVTVTNTGSLKTGAVWNAAIIYQSN